MLHVSVFLLKRTAVGLYVHLYQVDGFYIELHREEPSSTAERLVTFEDTAALEPYLWQVDVRELEALLK